MLSTPSTETLISRSGKVLAFAYQPKNNEDISMDRAQGSLFTDGSYKQGRCGAGYIAILPGGSEASSHRAIACSLAPRKDRRDWRGDICPEDSNTMEALAILEGLKAMQLCGKVMVYSDSQEILQRIYQGLILGKSGFCLSPMSYSIQLLVDEIVSLIISQGTTVYFRKVVGHSDNWANEMADEAARHGRDLQDGEVEYDFTQSVMRYLSTIRIEEDKVPAHMECEEEVFREVSGARDKVRGW
jgi:ribonuclease HI